MKNKFYIPILLISINLIYTYVVLPINTLPKENYLTSPEMSQTQKFISQEFISEFYTKIELGTPEQEVPLLIKPKSYGLFISSNTPVELSNINYKNKILYNFTDDFLTFFNETKSKSYEQSNCKKNKIEEYESMPLVEEICSVYDNLLFYDNINLKIKKKIYNMYFDLGRNVKDNITGFIGLGLYDEGHRNSTSFLSILKSNKMIDDYYWYFDLNSKDSSKGNIIIGSLPHQVFNSTEYSKKELVYAKSHQGTELVFWEMKFDKIYFIDKGTKATYENETVEFNFDSNVIIGTYSYKNYLNSALSDLLKEQKCFMDVFKGYDEYYEFSSEYEYFYCKYDIDTKKKLNELITSISFYSSEFDYTFELTNEQLLKEEDNYLFIHVIFSKYANKWVLGKPMLSKYQFVFKPNLRKIGFYHDKKEGKDEPVENNDEGNNDTKYTIIIIIPLIIYLCIGTIIVGSKKIWGKNKNEINDDYKNIDDKNNIDNNNKIDIENKESIN
jgi:hypothetical protein